MSVCLFNEADSGRLVAIIPRWRMGDLNLIMLGLTAIATDFGSWFVERSIPFMPPRRTCEDESKLLAWDWFCMARVFGAFIFYNSSRANIFQNQINAILNMYTNAIHQFITI